MAIIGFTGTPGSGKTYDAMVKIIDNLKMSRVVYTNIRGMDNLSCRQMIMALTGLTDYGLNCKLHTLSDEQVLDFWDHLQPGCLVVIDEVQNFFGSREWQSEKNKAFGRWASVHRHYGYEVVLISQHVDRIDTSVRALLEWTYIYRKINFFGGAVQKKYICYSYGGCEISGSPLAKQIKTYQQKIFHCYKSYVADDVTEMGIMKHANVLKHPVFFAIPVVFCITIYMVFFKSSIGTGDVFGTKKVLAQSAKMKTERVSKKSPVSLPSKSSDVSSQNVKVTVQGDTLIFTNRG